MEMALTLPLVATHHTAREPSAEMSSAFAALNFELSAVSAAGTSLGDPIEVGAAAAALLKSGLPRALPLYLTAAKSFMGHAEPAAGEGSDSRKWAWGGQATE